MEGDKKAMGFDYTETNFNPRPRVEGDMLHIMLHSHNVTFQSSPSCGGRRHGFAAIACPFSISILALVWRATDTICGLAVLSTYFNPRPRVEGDYSCMYTNKCIDLFQSSPSCGGRQYRFLMRLPGFVFQSSPSCGGRQ